MVRIKLHFGEDLVFEFDVSIPQWFGSNNIPYAEDILILDMFPSHNGSDQTMVILSLIMIV